MNFGEFLIDAVEICNHVTIYLLSGKRNVSWKRKFRNHFSIIFNYKTNSFYSLNNLPGLHYVLNLIVNLDVLKTMGF